MKFMLCETVLGETMLSETMSGETMLGETVLGETVLGKKPLYTQWLHLKCSKEPNTKNPHKARARGHKIRMSKQNLQLQSAREK